MGSVSLWINLSISAGVPSINPSDGSPSAAPQCPLHHPPGDPASNPQVPSIIPTGVPSIAVAVVPELPGQWVPLPVSARTAWPGPGHPPGGS